MRSIELIDELHLEEENKSQGRLASKYFIKSVTMQYVQTKKNLKPRLVTELLVTKVKRL
jgi:hypothetical protein